MCGTNWGAALTYILYGSQIRICQVTASFIQLQKANLAVDLADSAVGEAGGTLRTALEDLVHVGLVGQNAGVLSLHGGQRIGRDLGDGQS